MDDTLAKIQDEIDEAKRDTDELKENPGSIPVTQIDKLKDSLETAEDVAEGFDDEA